MFLWLPVVSSLPADFLKPPPMAGTEEKGSVVTRGKNGTIRSRVVWTMRRVESDAQDAVRMTESGQGHYSGFNQEIRWNIEVWWAAGDAFRPIRSERTVTDLSGKMLLEERKQFDWTKNQVRFERRDLKDGKTTTKVLAIPNDTLTVEGIAGALRGLPFDRLRSFAAHLLTNEPTLYDITLELRGRETVRTSAGTFDCYKVELVPHAGALNVFRVFFPKTYFWFTVDSPHTWVRYQGLESGPGSPEITIEGG